MALPCVKSFLVFAFVFSSCKQGLAGISLGFESWWSGVAKLGGSEMKWPAVPCYENAYACEYLLLIENTKYSFQQTSHCRFFQNIISIMICT